MRDTSRDITVFSDCDGTFEMAGIVLRDYFAAKAMAALIAEPQWGDEEDSTALRINGKFCGDHAEHYAKSAYKIADAMLRVREE